MEILIDDFGAQIRRQILIYPRRSEEPEAALRMNYNLTSIGEVATDKRRAVGMGDPTNWLNERDGGVDNNVKMIPIRVPELCCGDLWMVQMDDAPQTITCCRVSIIDGVITIAVIGDGKRLVPDAVLQWLTKLSYSYQQLGNPNPPSSCSDWK